MKTHTEDVKFNEGYKVHTLVVKTKHRGEIKIDNAVDYSIYERYISIKTADKDDKCVIRSLYFNDIYSFGVPERVDYNGKSTIKFDAIIEVLDGNSCTKLECKNCVYERFVDNRFLVLSVFVDYSDNYDGLNVISFYIPVEKVLEVTKTNIRKEFLDEIVSKEEAVEMGNAIKDKLREGTMIMAGLDPTKETKPDNQ